MPMGSSDERDRFHALQEMTGWQMLPQVFLRGEFVGGEEELRASISRPQTPQGGSEEARDIGPVIRTLGYGGLIPFVGGALALWLVDGDGRVGANLQWAFLGYGAVILSFLGAIHWGRVLQPRAPDHAERLAVYGVIPSLLAWVSLALPFALAAPVQAVLFVAVYGIDRSVMRGSEIPPSFLQLRLRLTAIVVVSILIAWASLAG